MFQIASDCLLLFCTNVVGFYIRISSELAQRKAFTETRECIEARLNLQKQNLQQVSNRFKSFILLAVLRQSGNEFARPISASLRQGITASFEETL